MSGGLKPSDFSLRDICLSSSDWLRVMLISFLMRAFSSMSPPSPSWMCLSMSTLEMKSRSKSGVEQCHLTPLTVILTAVPGAAVDDEEEDHEEDDG